MGPLSPFFFEKWTRYFLSLDADGLHLFETKSSTAAVFCVPTKEFKGVHVELGHPIRREDSLLAAKSVFEDLHNTILTTHSGDEIYMR
jgi:hypothetical protein